MVKTTRTHVRKGVSQVEYGLIGALIAVASIATVTTLGSNTNSVFCNVAQKVSYSITGTQGTCTGTSTANTSNSTTNSGAAVTPTPTVKNSYVNAYNNSSLVGFLAILNLSNINGMYGADGTKLTNAADIEKYMGLQPGDLKNNMNTSRVQNMLAYDDKAGKKIIFPDPESMSWTDSSTGQNFSYSSTKPINSTTTGFYYTNTAGTTSYYFSLTQPTG